MIHRVKFIRQGGKYWPPDRVGLPLAEARHYVARGCAVWIDPPPNGTEMPAEAEAGLSTHELTVQQVGDLVADLDSIAELRALRDSEVAHPQYEGGRVGALKAIDGRTGELA